MTRHTDTGQTRQRILRRLQSWLDGYSNHAESSIGAGAAPGSLAASQIEDPDAVALAPGWEQRAISNAFGWASMRIVDVIDHLRALSRNIEDPPTIFAPYTVGRAIIELTARVYWLLDPELSVRDRMARHVSEDFLYSFWEVRNAGLTLSDGATPESRIEQCVEWAARHGFQVDRGDRARAPWIGERRPNITRLADEMASGMADRRGLGQAYQIWAAKSHGTVAGFAPAFGSHD